MLDGPTIRDSIRLVNACGYDVVVPRNQGCCGSLSRQLGQAGVGERLQERNRAAFKDARHIVLTATGCARAFEGKATDICSFIAKHGDSLVFENEVEQSVLVHEPCSARNCFRETPPVEELVRRVPNTNVARLGNTVECCGAAGAYHIHNPGIARRLRASVLAGIDGQPEGVNGSRRFLLTANYGCGLFMREGLAERGIGLETMHPVSFLAGHLRASR